MTRTKYRLRHVRSYQDFKAWWNTVVDIRVKVIVTATFVTLFTVVGFQSQISAQTEARLDEQCQIRIEARRDLREVLTYMVDLSDVLPGSPEAVAYTTNRLSYIDQKYPQITEEDCA